MSQVVISKLCESGNLTGSASLYQGKVGSLNWNCVANESEYPLNSKDPFSLLEMRLRALESGVFSTLVAFGPGLGSAERSLLEVKTSYPEFQSEITYVPIDVNRDFLDQATTLSNEKIAVPVLIQCDFEREYKFWRNQLGQFKKSPTLYTMLGGTFANLDLGDDRFLRLLNLQMEADDKLLIDIPTALSKWSLTDEPRFLPERYTPAFRNFVSFGINPDTSKPPISSEENQALFNAGIEFSHETNPNTFAEVITLTNRNTGSVILKFRRYRIRKLIEFLEKEGWSMSFVQESPYSIGDQFGMAVVLIGKSERHECK